jgi:flagella basal body P-ring formation protein FlgA
MRPARAVPVLALAMAFGGAAREPGCVPLEGDRLLGRHLAAAIPAFSPMDPDAVVALAPAPGIERHFFASELGRIASRSGIATPPGGFAAVCFARQAAVLTREAVGAALTAALEGTGAEWDLIDYYRIAVPPGRLEFVASGLGLPPGGSVRVPVIWRGRLRYSETRSLPVWAKVRVWAKRERVIAAQALAAGTGIEARHLRVETVEEPPFAPKGAEKPAGIEGKILRRAVPEGEAIRARDLGEAPDVRRGEEVQVEARSGTALLKFRARAESPGRTGDSILVLNPENRRRFRAVVNGKGSVVVDPGLPPAGTQTPERRRAMPAVAKGGAAPEENAR